MFDLNTVHHTDALSLMRSFDDHSIDAYITDLPYGTTACKWDEIIPFEPMWKEVKRTLKPRGVFMTTASQPFTSALIMSNPKWFKYEWIWEKNLSSGFLNAKKMPLKCHENILVFGENGIAYNPQFRAGKPYKVTSNSKSKVYGNQKTNTRNNNGLDYYPKSILKIPNTANALGRFHPTQKPVALYEYLISTYTQVGDLVCDPCCGSGTTCIAAQNLERNFIACDTELEYVNITNERLAKAWQPNIFLWQEAQSAST